MQRGSDREHCLKHVEEKREERNSLSSSTISRKPYDNVNNSFLEELLDAYDFPLGIQSITIEMIVRWKMGMSYGAKKDIGVVQLTNSIIQGDAFSPLQFVLMIDPLNKILKRRLGD